MEDTNKDKKNNENNNEEDENNKQEETGDQSSEMMDSIKQMLFKGGNGRKGDQVKESYRFWDTQPVPKITSDNTTEIGPIEVDNDVEKERKEPYALPKGFSWWDVDINKDSDLTLVRK